MTENKKKQIKPGFCIGRLTVAEATSERKNGYTIWRCICDCGGSICLDTRTLQRGTVRDCGCETMVQPGQRDISGQRFGKLTAIYPIGERSRGGSLIWHCTCDCGGKVDAPLPQLRSGYRKSCGCLGHPVAKEILGKQFGDLTVIAYEGNRESTNFWRCQCRCGNEAVVRQSNLLLGHTKSCGCRKKAVFRKNLKLVDGTSVTKLEASRCQRLISTNSSGYSGVYRNKKSKRWAAQITFKGKTYYLGSFVKIEDAVNARKEAEERMYGEFLEWYYDICHKKEKAVVNAQ